MPEITLNDFIKYFPNVYFSAIDDTKTKKQQIVNVGNALPDEDLMVRLGALNAENYGIFFSFNQFKEREAAKVLGINAWAIDMDAKDIEIETQRLRIKSAPLKPSIIVESKNGYHCYWLAKDATVETYAEITQRLVDHFDADVMAKDISRLLRVPDFYHSKDPNDKFMVKCTYLNPTYYTEQEMLSAFPQYFEIGGISKQEFWKIAASLDNKMVLTKLSGIPEINGDEISFKPNSNGTEQIYVNGQSTSSWIDKNGMIGSHTGGAPTYIQWLQWYGLNKAQIAQILRDRGIVEPPKKREKMFVSYGELLEYSEIQRNKIDYQNAIKYPIKVLNDVLMGILRDELVVIGADTAVGKSELIFGIEIYNAILGKKVYGIHLEGRVTEITNRHIFNEIKRISDSDVHYLEYMMNTRDIKHLTVAAIKEIKKRVNDTLKIFNRPGAISLGEFTNIVNHIQYDADLIGVDHLHYFDFQDGSERNEINKIMQVTKDITEHKKIPTVLVSHFNRDKNPKRIPDETSLMGSSNIGKQADTVILVFPDFINPPDYRRGLYPTFIRVAKSRLGLPKNLVYGVTYDGFKKEYLPDYDVYNINREGELVRLEVEDYPYFLKNKN